MQQRLVYSQFLLSILSMAFSVIAFGLDIDCLKHQIKHHKLPEEAEIQVLSYGEFDLHRKSGLMTDKQKDELIRYAYYNGNPIIFRPAAQSTDTDSYSINLLWINQTQPTVVRHLLGQDDDAFIHKVLRPILDWQTKQPEAQINYWYDSRFLGGGDEVSLALENTTNILEENGVNLSRVMLRDIRSVALVQDSERLFEADIPIYFRVDLAKAIIGHHVLETDRLSYAINADADVVAVIPEQLFDQFTLNQLHQFGIILGCDCDQSHGENSFIMLHDAFIDTVKLHLKWVIRPAIKMATKNLGNGMPPYEEDVYWGYGRFRGYAQIEFGDRWAKLNRAARAELQSSRGIASIARRLSHKPMIFPPSRFIPEEDGYSKQQIEALCQALANREDFIQQGGR